MRVLFVGSYDWANVVNRVARGMNATAEDKIARVFTLNRHPYGYDEDLFADPDELRAWGRGADWIISSGDGDYVTFSEILERLSLKKSAKMATVHVGSAYRETPDVYNDLDKKLFDLCFIGGDLYRLRGDQTAVPFFAPPHEVLETLPTLEGPVRVCHTPSNPSVKGTAQVIKELPQAEVLTGLPFKECAQRRAGYHIYIDQINDLGGFGAAACEALASGCVVVGSTAKIVEKVDQFYPRPPIVEATSENLERIVDNLCADPDRVQQLRRASLDWAQTNGSPIAVGQYWLKQLQAV